MSTAQKIKYLTPDSELSEAVCLLALAASDADASLEDFDGNTDQLLW